jgi:uncharacterized protein (TIGR02996 family)
MMVCRPYNASGLPQPKGPVSRVEHDLEAGFLQALHDDPADETTWLALTDWLEELGQPARAELVRLGRALRRQPVMRRVGERARLEARVIELLAAGVRPVVAERVNSLGMRLALIPAGRFRMGSPLGERKRLSPEGPMHEVEITRPFYLGVFPVTQEQFRRVRELRPSWFGPTGQGSDRVQGLDTANFPIEMVSWHDAVAYCQALSRRSAEARAGRRYRLPTEAEWEYACRAGTMTPYHFGTTASSDQANFDGKGPDGGAAAGADLHRPSTVGSYQPNAFGLYDMHGNVWEWVADRFARDYYSARAQRDPTGPKRGDERMVRGGSWSNRSSVCRSATRGWIRPGTMDNETGFRVVCEHPAQDG